MTDTIIIAAGGSGGHLLPAQQLAILLKKDAKILFAGASLSKNPFFQREGFCFKDIASAPLSTPFKFLYRAVVGFFQSVFLILKYRPKVVIGFGSYHSFPVLAAAVFLRKKIVLYEANSILGKVNRLFFPFADLLALQFPLGKVHGKMRYVSYFPWIRRDKKYLQQEAREAYGLHSTQLTCLVFGGSQGASFFNQSAPTVLSECQVIHFTGKEDSVEAVKHLYQEKGIQAIVKNFEPDMSKAYAAADFVLGRSGAGTIAELISYQIPAVLVPFPHAAEDHQSVNARFFCEEAKGGFWVSQNDFAKLPKAITLCKQQLRELRASLQKFNQKKEKKITLDELIRTVFLK